MEDAKKRFGRRLAQLRKQRGFSQERLALESGLARSYLGGVERGQRNLGLETSAYWQPRLVCGRPS